MRTFVFVYNATSDIWNKTLDAAHKIISPSTYACDLCSLTHGNFSEKQVWKDFREGNKVHMIFMYKNEFLKTLKQENYSFPIIFEKKENELVVLFDKEKLSELQSVEELIENLQLKIPIDF